MGCSASETDAAWEQKMFEYEAKIFSMSGLEEPHKQTDWFLDVEMDGVSLRVRAHEVDNKNALERPTLVLIHGYCGASVMWTPMLKHFADKYRLIFFDMGGFGLNARPQQCYGSESADEAERWIIEWLGKVFEQLALPEKFLLAGHSCGGYLASLYASTWPDRVGQLFLISPGGTEPYKEETYDPYTMRDSDDVTQRFVQK